MVRLQRLAIAPEQRQQQQILLTLPQQHYLVQVLRLKPGDRFLVIVEGERWLTELVSPEAGRLLQLVPGETELAFPVTLMAALPKGQGFDQVVHQATELGVSQIIPVISERTLLHPSQQKLDRWRRIIQEAAEQSQRLQIPVLHQPIGFGQSLEFLSGQQGYICVPDPTALTLLDHLQACEPGKIAVAIGPEGGWTDLEVSQAIEAGFVPVSLGARVLRAVTAPVVALSLIAAWLEAPPRSPH